MVPTSKSFKDTCRQKATTFCETGILGSLIIETEILKKKKNFIETDSVGREKVKTQKAQKKYITTLHDYYIAPMTTNYLTPITKHKVKHTRTSYIN